MFSSLAVVTFLAASLVNAAPAARAITDCNPSYDVAGSTECFTSCNIAAGETFLSVWMMDSTSPYFIDSLEFMCDRDGANYRCFITIADPELFNAEWSSACTWWAEHKDNTYDA